MKSHLVRIITLHAILPTLEGITVSKAPEPFSGQKKALDHQLNLKGGEALAGRIQLALGLGQELFCL